MKSFSTSPLAMLASLWRNRSLTVALIRRDVVGRYRGSIIGIVWSLFHPVLMLGVYTLVFSVAFRARWTPASDSKTEFALILFAGLIVFNLFAECVGRAPTLVLSNPNYVKKVVFPLEVLPWMAVGSALFHAAISTLAWLMFYLFLFGRPHLHVLLLPVALLPLLLFTIGISWFLASLGVFLRDVAQVVGVATTTLMFLSPIFYPPSALPPDFQLLLYANPLTMPIEQVRNLMIWGLPFDWTEYALQTTGAAVVAWVGFVWFQRTRRGFADVL